MKNPRRLLIVACAMTSLSFLGQVFLLIGAKTNLGMHASMLTTAEAKDSRFVAAMQHMDYVDLYWYATGCVWYLALTAILIGAVLKIKDSN